MPIHFEVVREGSFYSAGAEYAVGQRVHYEDNVGLANDNSALAWISTERHSPNSQTAPSQSAESLTCRTRYVDWCADRAFCEFSHDPSAAMSETYPAAPLQENLLWHRPFCDSCRNWCSCVLNTGLAHTARKDVYQRTILPNLPRKILSPMNPLAVYSLGEFGAVEIQASEPQGLAAGAGW